MKQIFSIMRGCTARNCIWVSRLNTHIFQAFPHRSWIRLRGWHQAVDQWHVLFRICYLSQKKIDWARRFIILSTWSRMQTWILFAWHSRGPCWQTKSHPPEAFWENFKDILKQRRLSFHSSYICLAKWVQVHLEGVLAKMFPGWKQLRNNKPDTGGAQTFIVNTQLYRTLACLIAKARI